jgi:hypothetical protein
MKAIRKKRNKSMFEINAGKTQNNKDVVFRKQRE